MVKYYRVYLVTGDDETSVCDGMSHICLDIDVMVHHQLGNGDDEFIAFEKATSWSGSDIQEAEMSLYENFASYRFWDEYSADYIKQM
ncbi:hypothetical protein IAT40_007283 [Kwoniella sp. CBS 6097]